MFSQIKNKLEQNLSNLIKECNKDYSLASISPLLSSVLNDFIARPGKRIRPILFVTGYKGYKNKAAFGLYRSALSIELLHDFMLIHDDIIDKSLTRRGKPSMHAMLDNHIGKSKQLKFNGSDLSIVAGDVVCALAIDAFLSIKEKPFRKEKALKNFLKATVFTGAGEFIELMSGIKPLNKLKKTDVYKIYDYKTAFYTFSCPLSTGAMLAGAKENEINKLNNYGKYLGRAFQIRDDILGIFGEEEKTGKPQTSDLQEAKKTLLIFYAYRNCSRKEKNQIKSLLVKEKINRTDLRQMQKIILSSGALDLAEKDIEVLIKKSQTALNNLLMRKAYKKALNDYFLPFFNQKTTLNQHK